MKDTLRLVLNNENGGPNLEELIGIAYSLAVGAALFTVGKAMALWLKGAKGTVQGLSSKVPS